MYTRNVLETPKKLVQNGKINFGTFLSAPEKIDIKDVPAPYAGFPFPKFISNTRIKSRLSFVFDNDEYIGMCEFFDDKVFGLAEVIFWDKKTGKKMAYHNFMGPRRRFVPKNTQKAACVSFDKTRYMKISWNRDLNKISLSFTVKGDRFRPAAKGRFDSVFDEYTKEMVAVTPAPSSQRCSATWIMAMPSKGGISVAKHRRFIKQLPVENCRSMFLLNRTYVKSHSLREVMFGFVNLDGKNISFSFASSNQDASSPDHYNDNVLVIDKELTPMPPVCITHPFGISKKWVIQDTESMVDLAFHPESVNNRVLNIIVMRNAYSTIYGTFEGVLLSKDGEKIVLKNCPGIVKKSTLRL